MSSKKTTPPLRGTPPKEWNNSPSPKGWQAKPDGVVPKLRFPEFRGAEGWQEKKFSRMIQLVSGMHLSPEQYGKEGTVPYFTGPSDFTNNVEAVTKRTSDSASLAEENDTLITVKGSGVGEIWFLKLPSVAMGRQLMAVRSVDAASRFVFQFLLTKKRRFEDLAAGNLIPGLSRGDILDLEAPFPLRPEQQRIAECLSSVDEVIAAQAQKVDALKTHKKWLMQQLFPREGETQPRLRFSEFQHDGEWEVKRVDERGNVLAGKALAVNAPGRLRPYLRTKNVLDGTIDLSDVLTMPMTDAEFGRFEILDGDILLNEGQSLGLVGRASIYRGEFGQRCAMQNQLLRFRAFPSTCPEFAAQAFRQCQKDGTFANIATQTTSVAHLGSSRFSALELAWPPTLPEQQRIASCLSSLDALITAETQKLEVLKRHKRGLMQQLFPSGGGVAGEA